MRHGRHNITVYGLPLRPLTLGHLFLLYEHDVGFASGNKVTVEDLLLSAFICSQPHEQTRRSLFAWWLPIFFRIWRFWIRRKDFLEELGNFRLYLATYDQAPAVTTPSGGRTLSSPRTYRMLAMLMGDFHCSRAEALNCEMNEANRLWAAHGEREDRFELWSEQQEALWQYAKREDARKLAEGKLKLN